MSTAVGLWRRVPIASRSSRQFFARGQDPDYDHVPVLLRLQDEYTTSMRYCRPRRRKDSTGRYAFSVSTMIALTQSNRLANTCDEINFWAIFVVPAENSSRIFVSYTRLATLVCSLLIAFSRDRNIPLEICHVANYSYIFSMACYITNSAFGKIDIAVSLLILERIYKLFCRR